MRGVLWTLAATTVLGPSLLWTGAEAAPLPSVETAARSDARPAAIVRDWQPERVSSPRDDVEPAYLASADVAAADVHDAPVADGAATAHVELVGRVLGVSGAPLAERDLVLDCHLRSRPESRRFRTDERGWFRIRLPKFMRGFRLEQAAIHQLVDGRLAGFAGRVELARGLTVGAQDLGDIRICRVPTVSRGTFSGAERELHQVRLRLEVQQDDGSWAGAQGVAVMPHAEADFEMRALDGDVIYRLVADANRCKPVAPIEFIAGQFDLVVPLVEADGR